MNTGINRSSIASQQQKIVLNTSLSQQSTIDTKEHGDAKPAGILRANLNHRIIRTLRFESNKANELESRGSGSKKGKLFHILNIYELATVAKSANPSFECVLRTGAVEGTAIGGDTLTFPIGSGRACVDYFVAGFKGLFGLDHTFVIDSASGSE